MKINTWSVFLLIFVCPILSFGQAAEEIVSEMMNEASDTLKIVDTHPQDSPEDKGFLLKSTDRKSELRIRGSIRLNGGFDLNGLQTKSTFSTYDIPVGEANIDEYRYFMSIDQTRLGIEMNKETPVGIAFIRIEADFMNANSVPRLRHVYGSVGRLLIGQTWSVFGDVRSLPTTVDLDGPNSAVAERTVQIRYDDRLENGWRYSVSIESPEPDITYPDSVQINPAFQSFPDVAARFRKNYSTGHIQLAGILRSISVKDTLNQPNYLFGYGALVSGKYKLSSISEINYQVYMGYAISRFVSGITGKGLDVLYNTNSARFETIGSYGGFISYGQSWRPQLYSHFTVGTINMVNKGFQPNDAMTLTYYFSGNLFWESYVTGLRAGVEYSWGRRINKNDESGDANRVSFIFYYDF